MHTSLYESRILFKEADGNIFGYTMYKTPLHNIINSNSLHKPFLEIIKWLKKFLNQQSISSYEKLHASMAV